MAFTLVARPHEDIIKGKLTMDVFAADLWQVLIKKAPIEYQDRDLFFKRTYETENLRRIFSIAENRLKGKSGDSVIQLQTPFGGGKTHTLIALYHKAQEWGAKTVVLDGTAFDPKEIRLWEEIERQLTGKVEITSGDNAPGKDKLLRILAENSPVLILMDEVLEYVTKAEAVKVGDSNLAAQTLAFMQELTGAVSAVGEALLVLTLPSSAPDHYSENAERFLQQLQKVTGRTEKIHAPVGEEEIGHVIRKRLFESVDEAKVKEIVDQFVEYAKVEGLLDGEEAISYRERFIRSYPFKPEVVDVLYKRWGSFPSFQRTRGVLRLLSLVVHDLLNDRLPFIRLGDFNLRNDEIRRELIKHIGEEWDSIISQDITSTDSGASKVDREIQSTFRPFKLGTVVGTTIFMYSHSGGTEKGTTMREIKISTVYPKDIPSSIVDTIVMELKRQEFYLSDEGLYFTNQPNLNRILLMREENVSEQEIIHKEREIIEDSIAKDRESKFKVYIWPQSHKDIPDDERFKLVILSKAEPEMEFMEKYGEGFRTYRNTLFFLCTDETSKDGFHRFLRRLIAQELVASDKRISLTENQRQELENKIRNAKNKVYEELRRYYRKLFVPGRNVFRTIDLGIPAYSETALTSEIYRRLKDEEGEIVEQISPLVIKSKYFPEDKEYLETRTLYETFLRTPGEMRVLSKEAFIKSIAQGVKSGLFGLGYLKEGEPECLYFKEEAKVELVDGEIILSEKLCLKKREEAKVEPAYFPEDQYEPVKSAQQILEPVDEKEAYSSPKTGIHEYKNVKLKLRVPKENLSEIVRIVLLLAKRFNKHDIRVEIKMSGGSIESTEYEDKVEEALRQGKIEIEEKELD
ncbi:ATP-binding protein [Pseudothermotoga thermarum]|nr:ATP-binding protein [Pseudothermotoga thermarum]